LNDVRSLYDTHAGSLLDGFVDALHRVQPKSVFGGRLQIVSTSISAPAASELTLNHLDVNQAQELLTSAFERYLSRNGDVPVLPHASNQAIGGVMAARFENGDVFSFSIPSPDYRISITLSNLRKVEVSRTDAEIAFAYASYLDLNVSQPLSGNQYLDASFKYPTVKVISISGTPDDATAFQESLLAISDQVTQQLDKPSDQWGAKWLVQQGDSQQMAGMPALLERCR